MTETVDAAADLDAAVAAAAAALRAGELVVVPTDTVYGVAADAFDPTGTAAVFAAKRRLRRFPLPVLVRSPKQLIGLVTSVPEVADRLMAAYWPGPLTLVVRSEPNLAWDLGDNDDTVAVRMPHDDVTLAVIRAVGPLAVTSANLSGQPAATTAAAARAQLGDAVAVYVDGGPRRNATASTIVDLTRAEPRILRSGPLDDEQVLAVARGELGPHEVAVDLAVVDDEHAAPPDGDEAAAGDGEDVTGGEGRADETTGGSDEAAGASDEATIPGDHHHAPNAGPPARPRPGRHVARDHRRG